mgnify:CR=1 FL=1
MLKFNHLKFRYDPYPVGLAAPLFEADIYAELLAHFPPLELFKRRKLGLKYALSEGVNRKEYFQFLRGNTIWREFNQWVRSDAFIEHLLKTLKEHSLELPYIQRPTVQRYLRQVAYSLAGKIDHRCSLRSRFEFSMLPADGGQVIPHTDSPGKAVTLVLSMAAGDEWEPEWGGGTDINRPRHDRLKFNLMNDKAEFDDMEIVESYPYRPNQAVIFLRTYNSWHSVRPMLGSGSKLMRKTLTINVMEP